MIFLLTSIVLIAISFYFLFLGAKVVVTKRPLLIPARLNLLVVFIAFSIQLVGPIKGIFRTGGPLGSEIDWFLVSMPIFLVLFYAACFVFLWKTMTGYQILGVDEDSFRTALQNALKSLGLSFEERLSKMRLTSLETDLEASTNAWSGVATIKIKDTGHRETVKDIAKELQKQLNDDYSPVNLRTSYFYLIFGALLLIMSIGIMAFMFTNDLLWEGF